MNALSHNVYMYSGLWFYATRRVFRFGEREVKVTSREAQILELLFKEPSRVFTRDEILDRFLPQELYFRSVDAYIIHLRSKLFPHDLELGKIVIRSIRNRGYQLPHRSLMLNLLDKLLEERKQALAPYGYATT
jgi:OmpR family response regulator RpaB